MNIHLMEMNILMEMIIQNIGRVNMETLKEHHTTQRLEYTKTEVHLLEKITQV